MKASRTDSGYCCVCDLIPGWVVAYTGGIDGFKDYVQESIDFYIEGRKEDGESYPAVFDGEYEVVYDFDVATLLDYYRGIFSFSALLILWMVGNVILAKRAFDPYPFILLNLVLSCVAALQAPLIMMSQNRQEEKDRRRAENDYKVNLKTEIMIEDIHGKMNRILARQAILMKLMKIDENTMKQITLEKQEEMCAEACRAEKSKNEHSEHKEPEEKPES